MAIFFVDIQIKVIAIKCTGSYIYIYSTLVCLYDASNILFNIFYVINIELAVALIEWPKTI